MLKQCLPGGVPGFSLEGAFQALKFGAPPTLFIKPPKPSPRDTPPISIAILLQKYASSWQKVVCTPPICITIRLPFVSQCFCRVIRVSSRWNTPKIHAQYEWMTGVSDNGNEWSKFRAVPRSYPLRPLFSTLFNRGGNRRVFRLPGAGGGSFPLCCGTFARLYSVSTKEAKKFK